MECKILKRVTWPWLRPFQGIFFIGRVGLALVNQCTKFEVSRFTRYGAMNGSAKFRKWCGLRWLGGTQGHGQCHPVDRAHTTSYSTLIGTMCLFLPFSRYSRVICRRSLIFSRNSLILTHPTCIWHSRRGWPRSNFAEIFGFRKLESLGYRVVLFVWFYV